MHVKEWLDTLVIRDSKTKFKLERASQRVNQNVIDFVIYLDNSYIQLENLILEIVKI